MANQQNSYTVSDGTGTGNRDFSYTFPSFLESEVKVEIDNVVKTLTTHYTIVNHNNSSGGTVRFNSTGLPNGTAGTTPVRIFRQTNVETSKAEFTAGSSLKAQEINDNFKQVRHALQETIGAAATDRKIQRFNIEADSIDGTLIADDVINSEHIAAGAVDLEHMSANSVGSSNYVDGSIDRVHLAADIIDGTKIENSAVNTEHIAANAVTATEILNGQVTRAKLEADIIDGTKLIYNAVNSEHYTDGSIQRIHLEADIIDGTKLNNNAVDSEHITAGAVDRIHLEADIIDSTKLEDNAVGSEHIQTNAVTDSEIATGTLDNRYYTKTQSDAAYFNVSTGDTIKDGDTFPDNDTTIATTAAINDRIIDLVDDVGGFVPIANETSFPTSNPDVNNGPGTLISIREIASTRTPNTGTVTITNGAGSNTVTISDCGSTVLTAGFGVIVETTSVTHTYQFHRLVPKATEVTTVAGKATEISRLGTAAAVEDMSILGTTDVVADLAILGTTDVVSDMNTLAVSDVISDMNTLAVTSVINNMDSVATNVTNVNNVGGSIANVNTTAGSIANVNTVAGSIANVNTTAGSISNVNTTAGSISNVNSVASNMANVNNFADRYQIASNNPSTDGGGNALAAGDLYFNTSANELKVYNGSSWQAGVTATGSFALTTGNTFTGDNRYNDGVKALFGTGSDLEIYHDSTNSVIENNTAALILRSDQYRFRDKDDGDTFANFIHDGAVELYYDNSNKLSTTSGGVTVYGSLSANGGLITGADNAFVYTGAGNDLQLTHNGTDSYIRHSTGSGQLQLRSREIKFLKSDATGVMAQFIQDGAAELYYNNTKKFETTNLGATLTGSLNIAGGGQIKLGDSASGGSDDTLIFGAGDDLKIYHNGTHSYISNATGDLNLTTTGADINITAADDVVQLVQGNEYATVAHGNGGVELYYDNSKKFETVSSGISVTGEVRPTSHLVMNNADNQIIYLGAGNDLQIYHDGTKSIINEGGTGWLEINTNNFRLQNAAANETLLYVTENSSVQLMYDNSKKLETTSTGVTVSSSSNAEVKITGATSGAATLEFGDTDNDDEANISYDNYNGFMMYRTTANADMRFYTNGTHRLTLHKTGYLAPAADSTYDIGTSSVRFANGYFDTLYGDGSNLTGLNTDLVSDTSPQLGGDLDTNGNHILMDDSRIIKFGTDADMNIYHTGNHAYIQNSTGNLYIEGGGGSIRLQPNSSEEGIIAYADGRVHLYYDNSARLQTESWGSRCFGDSGGDTIFQVEASSSRSGEVRVIADGGANNADYSRIQKEVVHGSLHFQNLAGGTWENNLVLVNNGACEIYHDGSKTIYTNTVGGTVKGGNTSSHTELSVHGHEGQDATLLLAADDGDDNADYWRIVSSTDGGFYLQNYTAGSWEKNIKATGNGSTDLYYDNSKKLETESAGISVSGEGKFTGHVYPSANNSYDLGTSTNRWRNVYTNDLHLSNEGHTNSVDGTWGNWTIQEGESDLFLKNNRSGKKYKFNLTEVS